MRGLGCRVLGCAWQFTAQDASVVWTCRRCGRRGREECADRVAAARVAAYCTGAAPRPPTGLLALIAGVAQREAGEASARWRSR